MSGANFKRKRNAYDLSLKYETILKLETSGKNQDQLSQDLGIAKQTISDWWKNRESIKTYYESLGFDSCRKKLKLSKYYVLNEAVHEWYRQVSKLSKEPITGNVLMNQANQLALLLCDTYEELKDFKASSGWLARFKNQYQLTCHNSSSNVLKERNTNVKHDQTDDSNDSSKGVKRVSFVGADRLKDDGCMVGFENLMNLFNGPIQQQQVKSSIAKERTSNTDPDDEKRAASISSERNTSPSISASASYNEESTTTNECNDDDDIDENECDVSNQLDAVPNGEIRSKTECNEYLDKVEYFLLRSSDLSEEVLEYLYKVKSFVNTL